MNILPAARGRPVLRSAEQVPASARLLNNRNLRHSYCQRGERSQAPALLNRPLVYDIKVSSVHAFLRSYFVVWKRRAIFILNNFEIHIFEFKIIKAYSQGMAQITQSCFSRFSFY